MLLVADAVVGFGNHHVKLPGAGVQEKPLVDRAQVRSDAYRPVRAGADQRPSLVLDALQTQSDLILNRGGRLEMTEIIALRAREGPASGHSRLEKASSIFI